MSTTVRSSWLLETGQTREDTRLAPLGATLPADPVKVQTGILPGSADGSARVAAFWLKDQTTMTATIEPGRAVIQGMATQGAYPVTLAEPTVLTFADGDQQDRVDLVCLRVYDAAYDSTVTNGAALEIVKGEASATPAPPPVPALALPLYNITVPAGASAGNTGIPWASAVEDLRVTTVATGGVLPVYGNAAVPGTYVSQLRDHNDVLERWDSDGAWIAYPRAVGGIIPAGSGVAASYVGQYRDQNGRLQRWNGTAWDTVYPTTSAFAYATDAGYISSTTYVDQLGDTVSPHIGVDFTAPPTGAVLVTVGSAIHTVGSGTTTGYMAVTITQNGTVFSAANDSAAARSTYSYENSVACTFHVGGLTPGAACTATVWYRNTDSSEATWFDNRYLRIEPTS